MEAAGCSKKMLYIYQIRQIHILDDEQISFVCHLSDSLQIVDKLLKYVIKCN
jgi:hypothetical protein